MKLHWGLFAAFLLLVAGCHSSEAYDKSLSDTINALKNAPRVPTHTSDADRAAGAEIVLQAVPDAKQILKNRWIIGPAWLGQIPVLGQNSIDLGVKLNAIRHGQCLIRAGELRVDADKFCGMGSYMPNEGKWLAVGIASLDQNTSRSFLLEQLEGSEQYARRIQQTSNLTHE
jgi:hypothetical protein